MDQHGHSWLKLLEGKVSSTKKRIRRTGEGASEFSRVVYIKLVLISRFYHDLGHNVTAQTRQWLIAG